MTPDDIQSLSVVIPAFNEAARLPRTLGAIDRYFSSFSARSPVEVIVVDDGSTDETAVCSEAFPAVSTMIRTLRHPVNRGKGAAVRTGFEASNGDRVLLSDADLSAPIDALPRLVERGGPDSIVIGSRAVDRRLLDPPQPLYRDLMGRTFNLMVRALLLPGIFDTQCGFKLFPGPVARNLARVQTIDGFAFDVELLAVARAWRLEIVEVGVPWGHVEASRVLPVRHSFEMFRDLLRLFRRVRRGNAPYRPGGGNP